MMAPGLRELATAHAWIRVGRLERARALLEDTIDRFPWIQQAHSTLADLARRAEDWPELERVARRALEYEPEDDQRHKDLLDAIVATRGIVAAREAFDLKLVRSGTEVPGSRGPIACSVVRNEETRLPRFLHNCRSLGIDRHIVIDNGSTDRTIDVLAEAPGVEAWTSNASFKRANFGSVWFDLVLRERFEHRWVLTLDADEQIVYPDVETTTLPDYCAQLDSAGYRATSGILIDMYPEGPIADAVYEANTDFTETAPFFDRQPFTARSEQAGPLDDQTLYEGGPRQRVFPGGPEFWLTKTPLLRYDSTLTLFGGQHFTSIPAAEILEVGCAVLHFKFFSTLRDHAALEAERGEHSLEAAQYVAYRDQLASDPATSLYDPERSVRFRDSTQLVELALLRTLD